MTRAPLALWAATLVTALAMPPVLALLGMSRALGAHPWWDVQTALIGAPIGVAVGLVAMVLPRWSRVGAAVTVLACAALAAGWGKAEFAASFAENALAGRLWYFGWMGVAAGVSAVLVTLASLSTLSLRVG